MRDASPGEIIAVEEREILTPGRSRLENLPLDLLGLVVKHLPVSDLLGSLAVASKALRKAVRNGRASKGWNEFIRLYLKEPFEEGQVERAADRGNTALHFLAPGSKPRRKAPQSASKLPAATTSAPSPPRTGNL